MCRMFYVNRFVSRRSGFMHDFGIRTKKNNERNMSAAHCNYNDIKIHSKTRYLLEDN